jgi:hypothetical protein
LVSVVSSLIVLMRSGFATLPANATKHSADHRWH